MEGIKRVTLSQLQIVGLHHRLCEAYDVDKGQYRDGLTDKAIAAGMPFPCNQNNVGHLRVQMFGHFKKLPKESHPKGDRLTNLEALVASLIKRVSDLENGLGVTYNGEE